MANRITEIPTTTNADVLTGRVSAEIYMTDYAEHFYEWKAGQLIAMSPITDVHYQLTTYLDNVLETYLALNPIGVIRGAPFVMKLAESRREPDLQVILQPNVERLTRTFMDGAADICIEVVSEATAVIDYGEKFAEYEQAGVPEYWVIDPIRRVARFHRLNEAGLYQDAAVDAGGHYETPLLPRLRLHVPTLWGSPLPNILQIVDNVREMWAGE